MNVNSKIRQAIESADGDVTLALADGTRLVGPASVDAEGVVTITADGAEWLVDPWSILAVGR